jgi:hypothetical protein
MADDSKSNADDVTPRVGNVRRLYPRADGAARTPDHRRPSQEPPGQLVPPEQEDDDPGPSAA